jgi:hypothetical protein
VASWCWLRSQLALFIGSVASDYGSGASSDTGLFIADLIDLARSRLSRSTPQPRAPPRLPHQAE